jgi:photosystem II stability/assembly factor-like uncharacterized protein
MPVTPLRTRPDSRRPNTLHRRQFLGLVGTVAWPGAALAVDALPGRWPTTAPPLRYRDPARQAILAVALAGPRTVGVGLRGVIIHSDDGRHFTQAKVPVSADLLAVTFLDERHGWAVGTDGVIVSSDDAGSSWILRRHAFGSDERLFSVLFPGPNLGLAVGSFGLCLQTRDSGATWNPVDLTHQGASAPHLYRLLCGRSGACVTVGEFGSIYRATRSGPWQRIDSPVQGTLSGAALCGHTMVAVGPHGVVVASEDDGASWRRAALAGEPLLTGVLAGPEAEPILFDNHGRLYRRCGGTGGFAGQSPATQTSVTSAVWPDGARAPRLFSLGGVCVDALPEAMPKTPSQSACAA